MRERDLLRLAASLILKGQKLKGTLLPFYKKNKKLVDEKVRELKEKKAAFNKKKRGFKKEATAKSPPIKKWPSIKRGSPIKRKWINEGNFFFDQKKYLTSPKTLS